MSNKQYSRVRIVNPGVDHLVPLCPGQGFSVTVPKDVIIDFSSSFLRLSSSIYEKENVTYNFDQTHDLSLWSRISKVCLGEVILISKSSNRSYFGTLCVVLDTSNKYKSHIFTVINPNDFYVKVDSHSLINVVIYDLKNFTSNCDVNSTSGPNGYALETIEYRRIDTRNFHFNWNEVDNFYFAYPRSSIYEDLPHVKEHHFWFRCDYATMIDIAKEATGVYTVGKLHFNLGSESYELNVKVAHRNKNKSKIFGLNKPIYISKKYPLVKVEPSTPHQVINKNGLFKREVFFKKKTDSEIDSNRVIYT